MLYNIVKIYAVYFCDKLALVHRLCEKRQQYILLVKICERHKSSRVGYALFEQHLLIHSVSVDDGNIVELFRQLLAALLILFYHLYVYARTVKRLAEIMSEVARADYHNVLYRICLVIYLFEKSIGVFRRGDYGNNVLFHEAEITVCYVCLIVSALYGADKHIAVQLCGYLLYRQLDERAVLGELEFQKLHPALCEGIYLYRGRETKHARYLRRCCLLGVYDHRKSQLLLQIRRFRAVFRASYSGYGVTVSGFFRYKTAQKIKLVRACHRYQQIRVLYACLLLHRMRRAVSDNAHNIVSCRSLVHLCGQKIYHGYIVALVIVELLHKGLSDLAAAHYNYFHF